MAQIRPYAYLHELVAEKGWHTTLHYAGKVDDRTIVIRIKTKKGRIISEMVVEKDESIDKAADRLRLILEEQRVLD